MIMLNKKFSLSLSLCKGYLLLHLSICGVDGKCSLVFCLQILRVKFLTLMLLEGCRVLNVCCRWASTSEPPNSYEGLSFGLFACGLIGSETLGCGSLSHSLGCL